MALPAKIIRGLVQACRSRYAFGRPTACVDFQPIRRCHPPFCPPSDITPNGQRIYFVGWGGVETNKVPPSMLLSPHGHINPAIAQAHSRSSSHNMSLLMLVPWESVGPKAAFGSGPDPPPESMGPNQRDHGGEGPNPRDKGPKGPTRGERGDPAADRRTSLEPGRGQEAQRKRPTSNGHACTGGRHGPHAQEQQHSGPETQQGPAQHERPEAKHAASGQETQARLEVQGYSLSRASAHKIFKCSDRICT